MKPPILDIMQKKLRESCYFLGKMNLISQRTVGDPEEFQFLLSAFLSASRSIPDFIENKEYGKWLDNWKNDKGDDAKELLELMRIQRIAEVHRDGADILQGVQQVPITEIRYDGHGHPAYYGYKYTAPPGVPISTVGVPKREFKLGSKRVEVVATCQNIVRELKELVGAFETTYA